MWWDFSGLIHCFIVLAQFYPQMTGYLRSMTTQQEMDEDAVFPIGAVSEQTGVHSVTLRAWERRYGLIKPQRTPKGHRLYSQQDITRVRQVLCLLDQGIPVGRVGDVLNSRKAGGIKGVQGGIDLKTATLAADPWAHFLTLSKRCICKLDARSLDQVFNEAVALYSLEQVASNLLLPLCKELLGQCKLLTSTHADHSFWYEFLAVKLGSCYLHANSQTQAGTPRVIVLGSALPVVHLQALLLASLLSGRGFQVSLLGAGCCPEHLPLVLERSGFAAILFCSPSSDTFTSLQALARITSARLLMQYMEPVDSTALPHGVTLLPTHFGEALTQVTECLQATPVRQVHA